MNTNSIQYTRLNVCAACIIFLSFVSDFLWNTFHCTSELSVIFLAATRPSGAIHKSLLNHFPSPGFGLNIKYIDDEDRELKKVKERLEESTENRPYTFNVSNVSDCWCAQRLDSAVCFFFFLSLSKVMLALSEHKYASLYNRSFVVVKLQRKKFYVGV